MWETHKEGRGRQKDFKFTKHQLKTRPQDRTRVGGSQKTLLIWKEAPDFMIHYSLKVTKFCLCNPFIYKNHLRQKIKRPKR